MARDFFSVCVDVASVADSLELDGEALAALFNKIRVSGPLGREVLDAFTDALDSDGRRLLSELQDADHEAYPPEGV